MLSIFAKETPSAGSVLYRGNLPPRPEEFSFLEKQGAELKPLKVGDFAHWGLTARHPQWGEAQLVCLRETKIPLPSEVVMFAPGLTDEERRAAAGTSVSVSVRVPAKHKTVLKDRKRMLRWGRELMADDGLVLMDHQSMQGWGKERLDDELMHDADLDVEALYAVHGVTEDDPKKEDEPACLWMHTHGLGELGAFDFDIIRPHAELNTVRGADLLRSMAFAILEGKLAADVADVQIGHPSPRIRLVRAETFMAEAPREETEARADPDKTHSKNRSVVCEPGAKRFFGLGGTVVRANRALQKPLPEQGIFVFTDKGTEVMAQRARQTVHLVPRILEELAAFKPQVGAKIGYPTDGNGPREHMWFEVHSVKGDAIDATLAVTPIRVSGMKMGDRAVHPVELLTDWMVALPIGTITPRSMGAWRIVKDQGDKILEILKVVKASEGSVGRL